MQSDSGLGKPDSGQAVKDMTAINSVSLIFHHFEKITIFVSDRCLLMIHSFFFNNKKYPGNNICVLLTNMILLKKSQGKSRFG